MLKVQTRSKSVLLKEKRVVVVVQSPLYEAECGVSDKRDYKFMTTDT